MEIGLYLAQAAMGADAVEERAARAESLGFDSLWLYDHLYPPGQPDVPSLEAWTLATHLLARTTRLRVGHLVLCASLRHPALLAKMAATLDVLSRGRLELGLGSGSVAEEHHRAGMAWPAPAERAERLDEALSVVTAMLGGPRASFRGQHYQVEDLPNLPAAAQRPRPPVHVGGTGARTLALAARHADWWNVPTYGLPRWRELQAAADRACADAGRDPATLRRSLQAVLVVAPDADALDEARAVAARRYGGAGWAVEAGGFVGTPDTIVRRVTEVGEAGIDTCIFVPHDRGTPATLELVAERILPAVR